MPAARLAIAFLLAASAASAASSPDAEAHYQAGVAYGRRAEHANIFRQASLALRARDEFLQAVRLDPDHLEARFALVQYYVLAPSILGGSEQKALEQATEIRNRDADEGDRALAFIAEQRKGHGRKRNAVSSSP